MKWLIGIVGILMGCQAQEKFSEDLSVDIVDFQEVSEKTLAETDNVCPTGMIHIVGNWCPLVKEECEDPKSGALNRCIKYKSPVCLSQNRIHKDFCIDRTEYVPLGERLPKVEVDYYQAEAICKDEGRRLCKESEFNFACSGEEMNIYTTGLVRNCDKCNCDINHDMGPVEHRTDYRKAPEDIAECKSSFGVIGLNGNVDEITIRDVSSGKYKVALKGGHWMPIRARCSPATTVHSELYSANSLGFRCCSDTQ